MILGKEDIDALRQRLLGLLEEGKHYFTAATPEKVVDESTWPFREGLEMGNARDRGESEALRAAIKGLSVDIAGAARGSPLLAEADMQELRHSTRKMLASVRFREYRHSGVYVHHGAGHPEGQPVGQSHPRRYARLSRCGGRQP